MYDLAVLGHDPRFGGGGAAQTNAFLDGARALGREPTLLYADHPVLHGRRVALDRIEAVRQVRAAQQLAPAATQSRSLWVVATIATAGGAAPRTHRPYACWIGTSLDDEWVGRRQGLDTAHRAVFAASLPTLRRLERRVLRGAHTVLATSAGSRSAIAAAASLDPASIGVLPIPVDVEAFAPEPDAIWLSRLERPVLAFVGRAWDPRKNVQLLFEAMPIIRQHFPSATLRLIGEPPTGPLPKGVQAVGRVERLPDQLRTASLFVLPSRQEGFGIVAAEALACGVPVLATRSGGPEELIARSGGGRLLDGFAADELAVAASELLSDPATLTAMRRQGRAYVEREHSRATFTSLLGKALRDLD